MRGQDDRVGVGAAFDDLAAFCGRLRGIVAISAVASGIGDLEGVVHTVARENGFATARLQM